MGMEEESDNALKVLKLDEVKKEVFPPTVGRVGWVEDREGQDEKPVLDHSSFDGHIKVLYKSSVDGYLVDPVDIAEMKRLGLPITEPKKSFFCKLCEVELNSEDTVKSHVAGTPHMKKQLAAVKEKVKDENANISLSDGIRLLKTMKGKQTYYCDLCKLELNSEDTMKTHAAGAPHMKRMVAVMKDGNAMDFIKPIANPLPTRKKQPIRIQQKILESVHKIVGLSYVKECIPCSDSEMEPWYECHLCGKQGQANCMFQHLIGREHRQNFVNILSNNDPDKIELSQAELLKYAAAHDENFEAEVLRRIETTHSDVLYPWPPGKAPWLEENGGSGIIPDGAKANFGKTKNPAKMEDEVTMKSDNNNVIVFPNPASIQPPTSAIEAAQMVDLGRQLLATGMQFLGMRREDRNLVELLLTSIQRRVCRGASSGISARESRKRRHDSVSGNGGSAEGGGIQ